MGQWGNVGRYLKGFGARNSLLDPTLSHTLQRDFPTMMLSQSTAQAVVPWLSCGSDNPVPRLNLAAGTLGQQQKFAKGGIVSDAMDAEQQVCMQCVPC